MGIISQQVSVVQKSRATLAFAKYSLNATIIELKFSAFERGIDSFEMQLPDLKLKE